MSDVKVNNDYQYYKFIKTPKEMGIETGSSLDNVSDGVAGIFKYIKVLIEGTGDALKVAGPLGNKYLVETSEKCIEKRTGAEKKRSIYFNNVPKGDFGILGGDKDYTLQETGSFTDFRGLIPGAIEDMMAIGKIDFFSIFLQKPIPDCSLVKLKTIDGDNKTGIGEGYIAISDINKISPCDFAANTNPETAVVCGGRQGFTLKSDLTDDNINNANLYKNYYKLDDDDSDSSDSSDDEDNGKNKNKNKNKNRNKHVKLMMPDDVFLKVLFYSLGALSVYIALKLMANMYKKRD
jgi:hypothetical protein